MEYPDLHKLFSPPEIYLVLSAICFLAGLVFTFAGEAWAFFGTAVYRAEEPKQFWRTVATYYILAVLLIGVFLLRFFSTPDIYLILAFISFTGAMLSTYTGKTRTWGYGWVYRAQEPKQFWSVVAIYYLACILFTGMFFYVVT